MLALLAVSLPLAGGVDAPLVFLLAVIVLATWAAVAVHAWAAAAAARRDLDGNREPATGGGGALLWLTPLVVVLGAGPWILAGAGAEPALTLDGYLGDWRAGRPEAASNRFVDPPTAETLRGAWERQDAALRNAVLRIAAGEPSIELDPADPFRALRWVDLGSGPGGGRSLALEAARRELVRGELFGFLPATSQRLVAVERLGVVELRLVPVEGAGGPLGPVVAWRLARVEIAGEVVVGGH